MLGAVDLGKGRTSLRLAIDYEKWEVCVSFLCTYTADWRLNHLLEPIHRNILVYSFGGE